MMDNTQTSDILIYNALKKAKKEGNPLLKEFTIGYPKEGVLGQSSNAIFVATVDDEYIKKTMNSEHYRALVEIFVRVKQSDYITTQRISKTVIRVIKQIIRESEELKPRNPTFRNNTSDYGSKFSYKGRHLLVQLNEAEFLDVPNDEVEEICRIIAKVNEGENDGD